MLTLGPLMLNWEAARRRDFYARIADEAPVGCVHLGEVVCSKRAPFTDRDLPAIAERLRAGGKEVVISTMALLTSKAEMRAVEEMLEAGFLVEANDVSCVHVLAGRPHAIGPLVNVFNEGTLAYLARMGAIRVAPPPEVGIDGLGVFARAEPGVEIEATVFGRLTLSVAARCYHARAYGLHRDNCQFVCAREADGMPVETLDGEAFVVVNGTQTMSHGYAAAIADLPRLREGGVRRFRLMPQDVDMVRIARLFDDALGGRTGTDEAMAQLRAACGEVPFVEGYAHGRPGREWRGQDRLPDRLLH